MQPTLVEVKGGWHAVGDGWAVFGETKERALERYQEAERQHAEMSLRSSAKHAGRGIMHTFSYFPFARQRDYPTAEAFLAAISLSPSSLPEVQEVWLAWRIGIWEDDDARRGAYQIFPIAHQQPRGATRGWILGSNWE